MRKCRFCGQDIQDASRVCEHCGRDLVPASAKSVQESKPASEPSGRALLDPAYRTPVESLSPITRVSVVDVNMPFASMVGFMVKWALAAIPAIIILTFLGIVLTAVFAALVSHR